MEPRRLLNKGHLPIWVLFVTLVATACSGSEPAATVVSCPGMVPVARPSDMTMACGDGAVTAVNLTWSSWGGSEATAHGVVAANDFPPDRSLGHDQYFPATFTLGDLKKINGARRYLTLTVTYLGKRPYGGTAPWGDQSHRYFLGDGSGTPWPPGTAR